MFYLVPLDGMRERRGHTLTMGSFNKAVSVCGSIENNQSIFTDNYLLLIIQYIQLIRCYAQGVPIRRYKSERLYCTA